MSAGPAYRFFRMAVRGILNLYYRSIEVYGKSFIPRTGRTLFIANHQAGLTDGLLIVASLKRTVRTLAKHTLWENPIIRIFADGLKMIPVHRKEDSSTDKAKLSAGERNKDVFSGVEQAFVDKELVLLFPEGRSHDNSYVLKLRSGAARMLLQSEKAHDFRLGLKWLPISLDYEGREQPGSRVLIHYHPARSIASYRTLYEQNSEAAVEKLRLEMEEYLHEVTVGFATWSDRVFIERLTEIWLAGSPISQLLDRHNHLLKWKRIMENTSKEDLELWKQLRTSVEKLYASLTILNLVPSDIFRQSTTGQRRMLAKVLFRIFVWSPLIAFGLLFWWPPTKAIQIFVDKSRGSMDVVTSYKIVAGVAAYPVWLLLVIPWILGFWGMHMGLGLSVVAIATGLSALTVARHLRPQIQQVFALYRYASLKKFLTTQRHAVDEIWHQAARLWNRGLRRQILIEAIQQEKEALAAAPTDKTKVS